MRAAVYESTLPLLSNANVWFCPTSKVTEGAGADFLFDYLQSKSPPIVIVVRSPASIVSR